MLEWNEVRCASCKSAMRYDATICPNCRTAITVVELQKRKSEHRTVLGVGGGIAIAAVFGLSRCFGGEALSPEQEAKKAYAEYVYTCVESGKGIDSASCHLALTSAVATQSCNVLVATGSKNKTNGTRRSWFKECETELPEMTKELDKWGVDD